MQDKLQTWSPKLFQFDSTRFKPFILCALLSISYRYICAGAAETATEAFASDTNDKQSGAPGEAFEMPGSTNIVGSMQAYNLPEENWNTTNLSFCVVGASGIPLFDFLIDLRTVFVCYK